MKFTSATEAQLFLLEIGQIDECLKVKDCNYVPTSEQLGTFIKNRAPLVSTIKRNKSSSSQKYNWLKNRTKIMRGISRFHKSADGKKFHRKLGRFLATRVTESKEDSFLDKNEYLVALNSLKQHLLIELSFYKPLLESVETEIMIFDYALPIISSIETNIIESKKVTNEEMCFLFDMVSRKHFVDSLSEVTGQSFSKLHELCECLETNLSLDKTDKSSHADFFESVKKELNENK